MAPGIQDKLSQVSFCDGSIEQVQLIGNDALIVFRDWQERLWHLRFQGVAFFRSFEFGGDVSEVKVGHDTAAIDEAIATLEQGGGKREGYPGLVSVSFLGDGPMITLVCQEVDITGTVAVF